MDSGTPENGRFKIDAKGQVVDVTTAERSEVISLKRYYEEKSRKAKSKDMKVAYEECLRQINEYLYDDSIAPNADVFYIAYSMGLKDIRSMIHTYFERLKSREEFSQERFLEHISERRAPYGKTKLPDDDTIKRMFVAVMSKPPKLQEAADYFVKDYEIKPTKVDMKPSDLRALYNPFDNTLTVSPHESQFGQLALWEAIIRGLFDHLCDSRSWKFDENPEVGYQKQREETDRFTERMFGRCVKLGLMPPPTRGSLPKD